MDIEPRGMETVRALRAKGVDIPNPWSLDIGPEVDADRISGDGVTIHAGCRIRGAQTVVSAGCELGREGPVTIEDCRLGPNVALSGGYANKAVFLDGASMGLGHHVREGCLLEEKSSGAHCVGIKQTILFPYVTLGSLINFCDVLMAGGTSGSDHSEVGSSYIHFNFTPTGDKTTPSLYGDVPRGVMLRSAPIFLGGQGGTVGPVRVAYGTVVAAGSVLRSDVNAEGMLAIVGPPPSSTSPFTGDDYRGLNRMLAKNLVYLASLDALEAWYRVARAPFFAAQPLGPLVHEGALSMIASGRAERISRLRKLAGKVTGEAEGHVLFRERVGDVTALFGEVEAASAASGPWLDALTEAAGSGTSYLDAVKALADEHVTAGSAWLTSILDDRWSRVSELLPPLARLPQL